MGIEISKDSMAIVLSDVHLGALHSKRSFFNLFLENILYNLKKGDLPNLRALIILGDFFDLIMDSYKDLLSFNTYQNILENIDTLHQMNDFCVVFALGNHEIPVVGEYNQTFTTNKENMIEIFNTQQKQMGLNYSFFADDLFAQYILLQSDGTSQPLLRLFDTEQDMLTNSNIINKFNLGTNSNSRDKNNYLMAHGFQFDPGLSLYSGWWNLGLLNPFSAIKQIGDGIWNGFLKKIYDKTRRLVYYTKDKIKKMIKKETKKYIKDNKEKLPDIQMLQIDNEVNLRWKTDNHREAIRDNQGCINNIVNFAPRVITSGIPINHVIYGHTHDRLRPITRWFRREIQPIQQQFQVEVISKHTQFSISNTGAWQHVKKPSFIEIHTDWKVIPQVIPIEVGKVEEIIERKFSP